MAQDLSLMMRSVGLGGISLSELGDNHPGLCPPSFQTPSFQIPSRESRRRMPAPQDEAEPGELPACYQRDINPIERARRFEAMMRRQKLNITQLARELGRSRAYIRNHLRLLSLPQTIQDHVIAGRLSEGHARAISKMRDPEAMARLIIRRQLSVRDAETMARRLRYVGPDGMLLRETAIPNTALAENLIEDALGFKVQIKDRAGRGQIVVQYKSPKEFQEIVGRLVRTFDGAGIDRL